MKTKGILLFIIGVMLWSCGSSKQVNKDDLVNRLDSYMSKIDQDKSLEETFQDGALTDANGEEDLGIFKYYVNFDAKTKDLYRIKNIEETGNFRTESYYFKDNALVAATVKSSAADEKKIYLYKGKIISSSNIDSKEQDLLLTKAKRFQNEYKNK
ncbi:hypothetical protein [Formosa algae]|uniref:Uncharacterized protein n=1 Tax=Formosa algae TaxID=225843 RepID=A0A9X0YN18_9FLAO|nr:hypothetical protein [Formosa algae]MBP1840329.1 hypothetical protein [Formosa algae]MDQ0334193.1 hypothetical protein [Formosa algae]OEI79512.1 hypothetical protein AST99_14990 [Formosa algae]PNW29529.1 hypothetical protein BKP44_04195 [Formosa algae]